MAVHSNCVWTVSILRTSYIDRNIIGLEIDRSTAEGHKPVLPMRVPPEPPAPTEEAWLSYDAAMRHPMAAAYHGVMEKEWANLKSPGTVRAVERPSDVKILLNLWHLTMKANGAAKGCLVIEGSRQVAGLDFDESMTWVGVVIWSSVHQLLAEARRVGQLIVLTDFAAAYLNIELDGSTYMAQLRGFEHPGEPNKVYQLLRNLYSTHQAGNLRQKLLNEKLLGIGLKATGADVCVYYWEVNGAMATMHIDNMLSGPDGDGHRCKWLGGNCRGNFRAIQSQ